MERKLVTIFLIGLFVFGLIGCATVQKARETAGVAGEVAGDVGKVKKATTPVVVDKYESNDDLLHPTIIQMNSTTKATIEPAGDIDVFKVHVASNKREVVKVTFLNPTRNLFPALYFYNQNREVVGYKGVTQPGVARVSGQFIAQPNQDYYIEVYSGGVDVAKGQNKERSGKYYSLEVKLASVADKYEPNESFKEASVISLGEIKGTINPADDVDYYKIHIIKGGTVKVTFVNPTLNLSPALYFYNQNREEVGYKGAEQRGAAQVSGQFIAKSNQDYYIEVYSGGVDVAKGRDKETSTEFYTLKIKMVK